MPPELNKASGPCRRLARCNCSAAAMATQRASGVRADQPGLATPSQRVDSSGLAKAGAASASSR